MRDGFAFVDEAVHGIRWDAKYATSDNFTGAPVDGYLVNRVVGTIELCRALELARDDAASRGFGLLLWDGYRPLRATQCFVRWSQQTEDGRTKQRHYPNIDRAGIFAQGYVHLESAHSRGSTVDLTLFSLATGDTAAMGGDHDLMDAHSSHDAPRLSPAESGNRRTLREVMEHSGFTAYSSEWWHYSLTDEPYPETSFDFPVGGD